MNKEKILTFLLSAILFLTASFIVYSWSEPTGNMPSGYTAPLNTSGTGQTKEGWLKVNGAVTTPMIYDADGCAEGNCPYYINPSGNSVFAGTISVANPTQNSHVPTKGYVDGLFGNIEQGASLSNMMYVNGSNESCPDDYIMIMKHWLPTTCSGARNCGSCSTPVEWSESPPTCTYCTYQSCTANSSWDAAICVKVGMPLFDNHHTEEQCGNWNGEPVIVEENVKICKISSASCPGGWNQYKNWSTTVPGQSPFPISSSEPSGPYYYTGSHTWSNTEIESSYCNQCVGLTNHNYFCGTHDYCSSFRYYYYASVTEIGCY